jgi:hypothetical protein
VPVQARGKAKTGANDRSLFLISNYFTPLSIRQDATAFKERIILERSGYHIDLAFYHFTGRMCVGRAGTGFDTELTVVYSTADQSRDR